MRIQHNIMAMNAYRNYNNNNKALSGNLEKLSSGYKINRAGDDAAGLAISEKMRAQITGLNAAQKNVKDGISLVKTAEGAMQEIQDMLNRMDYLATQSANGTYQDEVDREALQKEVNQLNDEINRIADSANFNGIKLLDGTWDIDGKNKAIADAQAALDAANKALEEAQIGPKADTVYGAAKNGDAIKGFMLDLVGKDQPGSAANVGTNTILETEKVEVQKPSFQVSFNGVKHVMTTSGANVGTGTAITADIGGTAVTISETDIKNYLNGQGVTDEEIKQGYEVDGETLAEVFNKKIQSSTGGSLNVGEYQVSAGATAASANWSVKADGENLVFEFSSKNTQPEQTLNKHFTTTITGTAPATVAARGDVYTTGAYTNGGSTATTGSGLTITANINGKEVVFENKDVSTANATAGLTTGLENATATIDGKVRKLSDFFTVTSAAVTGGNAFSLESKATGSKSDSISSIEFTKGANGANAALEDPADPDKATVKGWDEFTTGTNGYINHGTEVTIMGAPAASEQLASTTLDLSKIDIVDGAKLKLGETEYTFAVGADSKYKDAENVVDLTNLKPEDLKKVGGTAAARAEAATKLAEAAKDNEIFTVSHEGTDGKVGLKQKAEAKETTDMTTLEKFGSYISISTVDQAATDAAQKELDDAQPEIIAKAEQAVKDAQAVLDEASGGDAKALNLQIGDTSDTWNQLGVKIGSMRTTALGVDGLSVATAEDAAAAIDTIKNAINYVSSVRGDLGAYQNRLEHTGNNLSVMAENIQDAESTIRDTDVAEEMMSYVKNNILVQSAQAMLAQANQVPQGVLQLLG